MTRPAEPSRSLLFGGVALLCIIWGTTWKVIQIGLVGIPPFTGAALRFALAGLLLLMLARARGVRLGGTRHVKVLWVVNGLCSFAISYGVVYWAEQWIPSGLAAILFATYPLFVLILAHFLLPSEGLTRRDAIGVLLGFGGVGLIFAEDLALLGGRQVAVGAAVMLASPVSAAIGSVSVKRWGGEIHAWSITSIPMMLAGGVLGLAALGFERGRAVTFDTVSVTALLYLTLVGTALTFSIYFWLLARLPATRLALIAYVIPIVAVGLGALAGEPITLQVLLGAACVVAGVAIAVQR